jgi:DNA-binding NarL/FixJ family response regulator
VQDSHPENWHQVLEQIHAGIKHMPKSEVDRILKAKSKSVFTHKNHVMPDLTPRQKQVLNIICNSGASNKVIARSLKISESTVKLHISCILKKYGMTNRTQLAIHAQKETTAK